MIHGWGNPKTVADVVGREFTGVDAIVFGHSHEAMNKKRGHVLYFNPGSPTDRIFASYTSYGMLEVDKGIRGKIIRL